MREATVPLAAVLVASAAAWANAQAARVPDAPVRPAMPRYDRIFVIIEASEGFD